MSVVMHPTENTADASSQHRFEAQQPDHNDATAAVGRLRGIADRLDCFLHEQLQRFDKALQVYRQWLNEGACARQFAIEEQRKQQQWEQQRDAEVQRLQQAGALLTQRWEELEAERRRLVTLSMTAAQPPAAVTVTSDVSAVAAKPRHSDIERKSYPSSRRESNGYRTNQHNLTQDSADYRAREFHELQRDMRLHANRMC